MAKGPQGRLRNTMLAASASPTWDSLHANAARVMAYVDARTPHQRALIHEFGLLLARTHPEWIATPARQPQTVLGHLCACQVQRLPADDKIIAGHIDVAHALVAALWKANK